VSAKSQDSVEERLRSVEDRLTIYQVVCGNGYAVDGLNAEAVGSLMLTMSMANQRMRFGRENGKGLDRSYVAIVERHCTEQEFGSRVFRTPLLAASRSIEFRTAIGKNGRGERGEGNVKTIRSGLALQNLKCLPGAVLAINMAFATSVQAQTKPQAAPRESSGLAEIVVTAQKREQSAQDIRSQLRRSRGKSCRTTELRPWRTSAASRLTWSSDQRPAVPKYRRFRCAASLNCCAVTVIRKMSHLLR
jgi:hypothetical protein